MTRGVSKRRNKQHDVDHKSGKTAALEDFGKPYGLPLGPQTAKCGKATPEVSSVGDKESHRDSPIVKLMTARIKYESSQW